MYTVIEIGTHEDFKKNLLKITAGMPVIGHSYCLPEFSQPVTVYEISGTWVHIVTADLVSATSYAREMWMFHVEKGSIKSAGLPWVDTADLRRSLCGS